MNKILFLAGFCLISLASFASQGSQGKSEGEILAAAVRDARKALLGLRFYHASLKTATGIADQHTAYIEMDAAINRLCYALGDKAESAMQTSVEQGCQSDVADYNKRYYAAVESLIAQSDDELEKRHYATGHHLYLVERLVKSQKK